MAVIAETGPDTRNLIARLWSNQQARSVIIQIVALTVVFAAFGFILRNVVINLENVGKEFNFSFFLYPAAYDITFSPFIEYSSRSTHLRAAVVGILNTMLVAACGIVLATIMGFIMGILRLSTNWLVNRLVYCFLEFTRNVPVLLHILFIHGLIVIQLPVPKMALNFADSFFLTNRGFYIPQPVWEPGAGIVAAAFVISVVFVVFFVRWAKKVQDETGRVYPVFLISTGAIVGATAVAFLAAGMPLSWSFPELKGFNFTGGLAIKPEFIALWLALSYYTSCFIAEIVRAGILAVSHGQTEAAYALGLRPNRTLQLIVIPQALRVIVPPLASQYLNLTKNSSLAIAIGYMDVVATVGGITLMQTGKEMETMMVVLLIYLTFSLVISGFMNWFNRKMMLVEREAKKKRAFFSFKTGTGEDS
ncbi:MAG: ABC transporter permease subunit [Proteobacteria bacterium]|nr:ABC transporter permease subunit [Pseudomonadota bacterium]